MTVTTIDNYERLINDTVHKFLQYLGVINQNEKE